MAGPAGILTRRAPPAAAPRPPKRGRIQARSGTGRSLKLTKRNIEDWDFRDVEPFSEADSFRHDNYLTISVVEARRLVFIKSVVELGYGTISEDGEDLVVLPGFHEQRFKIYVSHLSISGLFTPSGRRSRRVGKSLWREWKKYGRVKLRIVPSRDVYRRATMDRAAKRGEWSVDDGGM